MDRFQALILSVVAAAMYAFGCGFVSGIGSHTGLSNVFSGYSLFDPIVGLLFLSTKFIAVFGQMDILHWIGENYETLVFFGVICIMAYVSVFPPERVRRWLEERRGKTLSQHSPAKANKIRELGNVYFVLLTTVIIFLLSPFVVTVVSIGANFPFAFGDLAAQQYVDTHKSLDLPCDDKSRENRCNTISLQGTSFFGRIVYSFSDSYIVSYKDRFYYLDKAGDVCVVSRFESNQSSPTLCERIAQERSSNSTTKTRIAH